MNLINKFLYFFYRKLILLIDFKIWKSQFNKLDIKKKKCTKSFLVCSIFTMPALLKFEMILSTFLSRLNFSGYFLIRSKNKYYERIVSLNPNCKILNFDDFVNLNDIEESRAKSRIIIKDIESKKKQIEKQVLSITLRKLRKGQLNLDNKLDMEVLLDEYVEYFLSKKVSNLLQKKYNFNLLIINEKGYSPASEFYNDFIKRGKKVVQWVSSVNDSGFIFKKYNNKNKFLHPFSLDKNTWKDQLRLKWSQKKSNITLSRIRSFYTKGTWFNRQDLNKNKFFFNKNDLIKKLKINKKKKTAVIFSHILYDATFFFGSNIYFDYQEWLVETVKIAVQNKNINWILKVHPVNIWRSKMDNAKLENLEVLSICKELGGIPENLQIIDSDTEINTLSFIEFIDYGITVRGTVGLELSSFGKVVVTAGSGRYDGNGFTLDPQSKEEYKKILMNLHNYKPLSKRKKERAQKFFEICYEKRPIIFKNFQIDYKARSFGVDDLKYNLKFSRKNKTDFYNCYNTKNFTEWVINNSQKDILKIE